MQQHPPPEERAPPAAQRHRNPPPRPPPPLRPNTPVTATAVPRVTLAPTTTAQPLPSPSSVPPAHLLVLAVVVLIGGGYLVYSFAPRCRRASARSIRRQGVLKTIRDAQVAAAPDDAHGVASSAPSTKAIADGGASPETGAGTGAAEVGGGPPGGLPASGGAGLSELLPSSACVASTSAAIRSGLEKLGHVVGAATAGARARARSVSSSVKGKERVADEVQEDEVAPVITHGSSSAAPPQPMLDGGLIRRGRGKKGAKAGAPLPALGGSSSSSKPARISAQRSSMREIGVNSDRVATSESSVQTSVRDKSLSREPGRTSQVAPSLPAEPPKPRLATVNASVQTSPRLWAAPPAPTLPPPVASSSGVSEPLPAPAARPGILPLPFDLHASFQSTPLDLHASSHLPVPSSSRSTTSTSSSSYPIPTSPPLSPISRSRSPTNSSAHRSSPASIGASAPTSLSASPVASASRRPSATSSASGHLAVAALSASGRPRNARRKSGAIEELGGRGVVGLPGAVAAPRKGKERGGDKEREKEKGKGKGKDGDREREREEELARRRLSTASSSASGASAKSAQGKGAKGRSEKARDEETVRASGGASARRRQLQGLGVQVDDEGADVDGTRDLGDGDFPFPSSDLNGVVSYGNGVRPPSWTSPESSPHPSHRSTSASSFGAALATPTAQRPPWSPQLMAQQYTMIPPPPPPGTRPPSRSNSLSVPPTMSPATVLHGPSPAQIQQQQAQQLQTAHQQQQHAAYALAHAHAQAQVQAQYQHAVALQMQAQQQIAQRQHQLQRRRSTMPTPGDELDGFLSPTASATPSGFVYPLSSIATPPVSGTAGALPSPLQPSFANSHNGVYGLSQGASPTTGCFPSSVHAAHAAAVAAAMFPYSSASSPGGGYLASPAPNGTSNASYPHAHASPTQAHFQQQQQLSRTSNASQARPRLQSSVSAVSALGSGSKSGSGGVAAGSLGQGGKSSRATSRSASGAPPASPGGHSGGSAPISGGVQLGDPPGAAKTRLRQAEMDADRTVKELEIARWKLAVLEDEQRAAEIENQEALRALATRAMRAEARIKLLEEAAKAQQQQTAESPTSNPASNVPSTSSSPVVQSALAPLTGFTPAAFLDFGGASSPGSGIHPLSWLDLDAVTFNSARSFNPPRSPNFLASTGGGNSSRRNKRSPSGGNNGRRTSGGPRRRSSASPSAPPPPPEIVGSDDEDVLIVLDAPTHRHSVYPRQQTPSRRSSYAPDEDALDNDASSYLDEEEIPSIDIDEADAVLGESDDGVRQHPAYVGFLPARLSPHRSVASASGSPLFDAVECGAFASGEPTTATLSIPSFTLDASPEPEVLESPASVPISPERPSPLPQEVDSPEGAPTPVAGETNASPKRLSSSPTGSDQQTPRIAAPTSPPASPDIPRIATPAPRSRSRSRSPASRRAEDTPLPPSPLVHASA